MATSVSNHIRGLPPQTQAVYEAIDRLSRNLPRPNDSQLAARAINQMCLAIQAKWSDAERASRSDGRSLQELDTFRASIAPDKEFSWDTAERSYRRRRKVGA